MEILISLFYLFIFPGFLFLSIYGTVLEWINKKFLAFLHRTTETNLRQFLIDSARIFSEKDIVPGLGASYLLPFITIASAVTLILLVPVHSNSALSSFRGDLIVAIYLLALPAVAGFVISLLSRHSCLNLPERLAELLLAEVLFLLTVMAPAVLAGTWNTVEISRFMAEHPMFIFLEIPAFLISLIALQIRLEKIYATNSPGEQEESAAIFIQPGSFSGTVKISLNMEMLASAALINAVFLGGSLGTGGLVGLVLFLLKTAMVSLILSAVNIFLAKAMAKAVEPVKETYPLASEDNVLAPGVGQIKTTEGFTNKINLCWKALFPLALAQIILNAIIKWKLG